MPIYYWNSGYMIGTVLVLLAGVLAMFAQAKVTSAYNKYKRVPNSRGMTGAQVAREILDSRGLYHISVHEVSGQLSDHYNPSKNLINLSTDVYRGTSIASLAVAAHEVGHAIQYQEKYMAIGLRNMILPFANVGQYLGWIAIVLGLAIGHTNIAWIGFILMCGILLFQIVTLPVEFNASSRAMDILRARYLTSGELVGARNMLSAAALTYVAAMVSTLMSMLRIFLMLVGRSRDN